MRTTVDLPDELYRTLKTRAAISGVTLRELIQSLIEEGLKGSVTRSIEPGDARTPPPVIIPPTGKPLPDLSPEALHRLEEADYVERYG